MGVIRWTLEAASRLEEIHAYLRASSPQAAASVVEGICGRISDLQAFPRLGQRYGRIRDREVRMLVFGHYRIAYLVKSSEEVEILAILHGAMDFENYVF